MINNKIKIVAYLLGICLAVYVTGLRLFAFVFNLGFKTPDTNNLPNFLMYDLPDFISVIFCFSYILFFYKRLKYLLKNDSGIARQREMSTEN